jgi:aldehyde dehydrogenase (NAD+)
MSGRNNKLCFKNPGYYTMNKFQEIFELQKKHFHKVVKFQSADERILKLKKLANWIIKNQSEIRDALARDFHKPQVEADITDIKFVLNEIDHACKNLRKWLRPKKVRTPLFMIGTRSKIIYEAKGVVLIIAPWNFPFMLPLSPLVSALAAGNCAVIKPSEMSPHTSAVIEKLARDIFPPEEVSVLPGDEKTGQSLIDLPFDHIFFTGSERVGKIIMESAAKNLSSVTLELGGQNPVIVDETARINEAAERIVQGKLFNAGQSCVAPNMVYVHTSVADALTDKIKFYIKDYYPDGFDGLDYTHIVNDIHFERLKSLLQDAIDKNAQIIQNNFKENSERIFAPAVLTNVKEDAKINNEEIFGPILIVVCYENINEIINKLITGAKPLALFIFSQRKKNINYILKNISSGTVAVNSTSIQFLQHELPFGGVNQSGIGRTHGYYGFLDFSNVRAVLKQKNGITGFKLLRPPYTELTKKIVRLIMKYV